MKKEVNKTKYKNISCILIFISIILFVSANWLVTWFGNSDFSQYLYHLFGPVVGSNTDVIYQYLFECIPLTIINLSLIYFSYEMLKKELTFLYFKKHFEFFRNNCLSFSVVLFVFTFLYSLDHIGFITYMKNQSNYTKIYDDYYISPSPNIVKFNEENKRNVIMIYLESMESSVASIEHGGAFDDDLIPALYKLSNEDDSVTFSINDNQLGGAIMTEGTGWTIAGMVATTTGIPLNMVINYDITEQYNKFLPGVESLGDILEDEGYKQVLMIGSDAKFGNRETYFTQHGNYEFQDYNYAKEKGLIPDDYNVWWGYEDSKLFSFAKNELLELAKGDAPFNFTMLTADTHFVGGYLDESCVDLFGDTYNSSYYCSSNMVYNFIKWIKEQDFYNNTTIVVMGDHPTMDLNWYNKTTTNENYVRTTYNCIINSAVSTKNTKNRTFTSMDMFPTILASMGANIEGERLGIGTNLFSDIETVAEEMGIDVLSDELVKQSKYYNNRFVFGLNK